MTNADSFFLAVLFGAMLAIGFWLAVVTVFHASPAAIDDLRCRIERLEGTPEPQGEFWENGCKINDAQTPLPVDKDGVR